MSEFEVDPGLLAVGYHLADWPLSRVFLYTDSRDPWGMLVPRRPDAVEICDLSQADQHQLMDEISDLSKIIRTLLGRRQNQHRLSRQRSPADACARGRPAHGRPSVASNGMVSLAASAMA